MIEISQSLEINESEIELTFIRAEGPGGQNVNKVASSVQLRFDIESSPSLPEEVKKRLISLAGKRVTQDKVLVLEARRYRTQEQNREDALQRFQSLVRKALEKPKVRKKTKPTKASQEERIKEKKRRGELKQSRSKKSFEQF